MKKRGISFLCSLLILGSMVFAGTMQTNAGDDVRVVDGSALTTDESSTGIVEHNSMLRGKYMMDGMTTISRTGIAKIRVYSSTTADFTVDYLATIAYVDQFNEETGNWEQIDAWVTTAEDDYYVSTQKILYVDHGYYYRAHSDHIAGNRDDLPYDEAISFTDGIWVP